PRRLGTARFLVSAIARHEGLALRPLFVGWLSEILSPTWGASVWALPPKTDLAAGSFVFGVDGALAGLAVEREGQSILVPADTLLAMAERLVRDEGKPRGELGIDVQPLTSAISAGAGVPSGVVVTWVDPHGPAAGRVNVTDIIEAVDGEKIT